jgi:hypothetical protein
MSSGIVSFSSLISQLFVSNVLTGTVARLDLNVGRPNVTVQHQYIIADGYIHGPNTAAFVLGPTGLALDQSGNLFVASMVDNAIYKVSNASKPIPPVPANKGMVAFSDRHLRGPLALVFSPTGTLLTANGDAVDPDPAHPSEIVEFTTAGVFIRELNIEATEGGAFGLAINTNTNAIFDFAAVDDITNSVILRDADPYPPGPERTPPRLGMAEVTPAGNPPGRHIKVRRPEPPAPPDRQTCVDLAPQVPSLKGPDGAAMTEAVLTPAPRQRLQAKTSGNLAQQPWTTLGGTSPLTRDVLCR